MVAGQPNCSTGRSAPPYKNSGASPLNATTTLRVKDTRAINAQATAATGAAMLGGEEEESRAGRDVAVLNCLNHWKQRPDGVYALFPRIAQTRNKLRQLIAGVGRGSFQQKVMEVIKSLIACCREEYEHAKSSGVKSRKLARSLNRTMDIIQCICTSLSYSHEYLHRMCELAAIYAACELRYAKEAHEEKFLIANRISHVIHTHLKVPNEEAAMANVLRMFVYLPDTFEERDVLVPIFNKFIPRPRYVQQQELPDRAFIQHIIVFYQWLNMETDFREKIRIVDFANRFIRPAPSLRSNAVYAYHLPRYDSHHNATKFILLNLKFFKDLQNASINDNCLKIDDGIIEVGAKDARQSVPPSEEFAQLVADVDCGVEAVRPLEKLEHQTVVATVDLTQIEETDALDGRTRTDCDEEEWLSSLRFRASNSAVSLNDGVMHGVAERGTETTMPGSAPEVIEIHSDSESEATMVGVPEPDLFNLDFDVAHEDSRQKSDEEVVSEDSFVDSFYEGMDTDSPGDDFFADPTQISSRFTHKPLRTYSARDRRRVCAPDRAPPPSVNEPTLRRSPIEIDDLQASHSGEVEFSMPRIVESFSCHRDSIPATPMSASMRQSINAVQDDMADMSSPRSTPSSSTTATVDNTLSNTSTSAPCALQSSNTLSSSSEGRLFSKHCSSASPVSSTSSLPSEHYKQAAEQEHLQALSAVFSKYDIFKERPRPPKPSAKQAASVSRMELAAVEEDSSFICGYEDSSLSMDSCTSVSKVLSDSVMSSGDGPLPRRKLKKVYDDSPEFFRQLLEQQREIRRSKERRLKQELKEMRRHRAQKKESRINADELDCSAEAKDSEGEMQETTTNTIRNTKSEGCNVNTPSLHRRKTAGASTAAGRYNRPRWTGAPLSSRGRKNSITTSHGCRKSASPSRRNHNKSPVAAVTTPRPIIKTPTESGKGDKKARPTGAPRPHVTFQLDVPRQRSPKLKKKERAGTIAPAKAIVKNSLEGRSLPASTVDTRSVPLKQSPTQQTLPMPFSLLSKSSLVPRSPPLMQRTPPLTERPLELVLVPPSPYPQTTQRYSQSSQRSFQLLQACSPQPAQPEEHPSPAAPPLRSAQSPALLKRFTVRVKRTKFSANERRPSDSKKQDESSSGSASPRKQQPRRTVGGEEDVAAPMPTRTELAVKVNVASTPSAQVLQIAEELKQRHAKEFEQRLELVRAQKELLKTRLLAMEADAQPGVELKVGNAPALDVSKGPHSHEKRKPKTRKKRKVENAFKKYKKIPQTLSAHDGHDVVVEASKPSDNQGVIVIFGANDLHLATSPSGEYCNRRATNHLSLDRATAVTSPAPVASPLTTTTTTITSATSINTSVAVHTSGMVAESSLALLADTAANQLPGIVAQKSDATFICPATEEQSSCCAGMHSNASVTSQELDALQDPLDLNVVEVTQTVPPYLFNGESRDVCTPEVGAIVNIETPASQFADDNGEPEVMYMHGIFTEMLPTSEQEVSSTQEPMTDAFRTRPNDVLADGAMDAHFTMEQSVQSVQLVQNNQVDTTHHFVEQTNITRRRRRRQLSTLDKATGTRDFQAPAPKQRRKTISAETAVGESMTTSSMETLNAQRHTYIRKSPPNGCNIRLLAFSCSDEDVSLRPPSTSSSGTRESPALSMHVSDVQRTYTKTNVAQKVFVPAEVEECIDSAESPSGSGDTSDGPPLMSVIVTETLTLERSTTGRAGKMRRGGHRGGRGTSRRKKK